MTEEGTPLNSILDDEPTEDVTEAAPAEVATEEPTETQPPDDGQPRGPDGKFLSKQQSGVEDTAPPADKLSKEDYGVVRAIRDENKGLKAELENLRNQFQASQQPKDPPPPPPSLWEDEQGWQQHLQQQVLRQADQLSRINASEMAARSQHTDFQEMFDLFNEMATQNPSVVQQAMADPHPWGKAYQIAKNHKTMTELGAVDLADLEAKVREKVMAEMQQGQTPLDARPAVPPTLTTERNVGTRSGPAWGGPKPLAELLG